MNLINYMKIGIDARLYGKQGRGIGRYIKNIIKELEKLDYENEYFIFLYKENFDEYIPKNPNFKKILINIRWYSLKEQLILPFILKKYKLDLMFFPHFNFPILYHKKFFLTIHDLLIHRFPNLRATILPKFIYYLKLLGYKIVFRKAITDAEIIFVPSNFVKNEILKFYPNLLKEKIKVSYLGIENFKEMKNKSFNFKTQYFLYVGAFYPHKNINFLIESFLEYKKFRKNINLYLIGRLDYFGEKIKQKYKAIKEIKFLGYVEDEMLLEYYKNAKAFIFPSIYEGFGLPPLEALSLGCKVFASDIEVLREILKDKVYYFNPYKKIELINLMLKVDELKFPENIDEFIKIYDWKQSALKFYRGLTSVRFDD